MKVKEMLEYNLKLNDEYFLFVNGNEWHLRRNKMNIYEVMNNKTNNVEELKKFVKEHKTYNYLFVDGIREIIVSFFVMILGTINLWVNSSVLRYFICGALFTLLIELLVRTIVNNYNNKIKEKIFKEDKEHFEKLMKDLEEKINDKKRIVPKDKKNK